MPTIFLVAVNSSKHCVIAATHSLLFLITSAGPAMCYAFTYALGDRKVDSGKPDTKAFIRNRYSEQVLQYDCKKQKHSCF